MKVNKYNNLNILDISFLIFLCIMFGGSVVAIKVSLAGIGSYTAAGLRFGIAAIVISIWAIYTKRPFKLRQGQLHKIIILSLIFIVHLSLVYLGIKRTYAARAALLTNIQPFFVLILAHLFTKNDRITAIKFISMIIGFSGVAIIFMDFDSLNPDIRTGDILIILSSFFWATSATFIKSIIHRFRTFHIVFYPMLITTPFFLILGYFLDDHMISYIDMDIVFAMFYQSVIASSFGFIAWNYMLSKTDATKQHTFVFIMPVSGVIFSGLLLNEPVTLKIIISLFLIGIGIWLVNSRIKNSKQQV